MTLDLLNEATTASAFESGHQIELQLGHFCNDRCVFCVSGQLSELKVAKPVPVDPILEALESAAAKGIRRVTFLGGEPTIQRAFLPALERAVKLGFDDVVIFTNGAQGRNRKFLDRVMALGRFTWRFSIQGADEATHEAATARKGSWGRLIAGVEYLASCGEDLTANTCVNERSYRSLPGFPELVRKHRIRQLHVDVVRPSGIGNRTDEYLSDIITPNSEMVPFVREMLERFHDWAPDFDVNIGNFPFCLLPEWAHAIHHGGQPTLTLTSGFDGDMTRLLRKYDFQASDATYAPGCGECVFRPHCRGVPDKYAELHGTGELSPVSRDGLLALDKAQNAFGMVADPWLEALARSSPPRGWRVIAVHRDTPGRHAAVELAHDSGESAEVRLTPVVNPPPTPGPPFLVTERFRLGVTTTLLEEGDPLAVWARRTIEGAGFAPVSSRWMQALTRALKDLRAEQRFGEWRLVRLKLVDGARGAELGFVSDDGRSFDTTLWASGRTAASMVRSVRDQLPG